MRDPTRPERSVVPDRGRPSRHARRGPRAIAVASLVALSVVPSTATAADATVAPATAESAAIAPADCAPIPVTLAGADPTETADACAAIRAATRFLEGQGLPMPSGIVLRIAPTLPSDLPDGVLACHRPASRTIDLLTQAALAGRGEVYGLPPDRIAWRALLAHEVAHATLSCAMPPPGPTLRASEYVAGVVMLETLDPARRDRLLAATPREAFADEEEIVSLAFVMDPAGFAVRAWSHWRGPGGGAAFLRAIVERRALAGAEP